MAAHLDMLLDPYIKIQENTTLQHCNNRMFTIKPQVSLSLSYLPPSSHNQVQQTVSKLVLEGLLQSELSRQIEAVLNQYVRNIKHHGTYQI